MGWKGRYELTSEVPCTKDLLGAATFWDLLVAWLGAHDLGRPLILSRVEYCEHCIPFPWIQHLTFPAMDLVGKPACLEFELLFPLDPSCGSCTSVYPKLLDLFPLLLITISQVFPC